MDKLSEVIIKELISVNNVCEEKDHHVDIEILTENKKSGKIKKGVIRIIGNSLELYLLDNEDKELTAKEYVTPSMAYAKLIDMCCPFDFGIETEISKRCESCDDPEECEKCWNSKVISNV